MFVPSYFKVFCGPVGINWVCEFGELGHIQYFLLPETDMTNTMKIEICLSIYNVTLPFLVFLSNGTLGTQDNQDLHFLQKITPNRL